MSVFKNLSLNLRVYKSVFYCLRYCCISYVFDGKPPQMKGGELAKRTARRAEAEAGLKAAQEVTRLTIVYIEIILIICMSMFTD